MKTLLKKEFGFTAIPLTYIFLLAAFMAFLPGYPILCGPFFICLGIFYTFQIAREGNDVLYTTLLPVKKANVVKARYIWVTAIQMIGFFVIAVITGLRMVLLHTAAPYLQNPLMNANFMYLGFSLLVFASFNTFFVGGYWKDAYKIGFPLLKAGIAIFIVIFIGESIHFISGLEAFNTPYGFLSAQLSIFAIGILIYILSTIFSCKVSMKRFEKMDLHM